MHNLSVSTFKLSYSFPKSDLNFLKSEISADTAAIITIKIKEYFSIFKVSLAAAKIHTLETENKITLFILSLYPTNVPLYADKVISFLKNKDSKDVTSQSRLYLWLLTFI